MLNGNLAHNFEPRPLPATAWASVTDGLKNRGFPQEGFLKDYSFSSSKAKQAITVNVLAFTHAIHRNPGEYAGFTVFNSSDSQEEDVQPLIPILAESSAPFHLIHNNEKFSFWVSTFDNEQIKPKCVQSNISYDQLNNVLIDYSVDIKPQRIIDVKQGRDTFTLPIFRDAHSLQLSLWVADVTGKLLVDYFSLAVDILRNRTHLSKDTGAYDSDVTSLSIQLLGAVILSDTGVLGNDLRLRRASLWEVIKEAQIKFPRYFRQESFEKYHSEVEEAYNVLKQVCYSNFVPDMLTSIYTTAYDTKQRKKLGRFDTPLYLTRRIWDNIPIEYLPPSQRFVADMTCGWGSFLIAGHERLANLSDTGSSLREYLRGNDIDNFTANLAGLGLLLSTSEDSWAIDHADAFEWNWLQSNRPNIIVGNPPFGADRKTLRPDSFPSSDKRTRTEKANNFLEYAIERLAPNGYLAMLMPSSFIGAEASPGLRKRLLHECDILELWDLPTGIFPDATVQSTVIFAQKKNDLFYSYNPVRVRTVQAGTVKNFKNSGSFTVSGIVSNQSAWREENIQGSIRSQAKYLMDYKIILPEYKWQEILSRCSNLADHSEIIRGAIVGKKESNKRWRNYEFPKEVPWLTGVKNILKRPFLIDYSQSTTIFYPNMLEEPRKSKDPKKDKEYILSGEKVLLAYDPNPTWGKRVKIAIERRNYYVSDSFWVIAPKKGSLITCEVLAAILNWDICNAWIVEFLKSPAIAKRAVSSVPFPNNLSLSDCETLTEAIRQIEQAAWLEKQEPQSAFDVIDTILKQAYGLDNETFERLRKITEWNNKTVSTLDAEQNTEEPNWFLSGIVSSIDAAKGTITLWLEGFDELQTVQITSSMPGWLLRTNAAFCTKIPFVSAQEEYLHPSMVDWSLFRPQPYTYMNEEELLGELTTLLPERARN